MNQNKGIILVLSTALISGLAIFINRFGVAVISSDIYTFLKNLVAGLLIVGLILLFKEWRKVRGLRIKDWFTLILIGLIGGSIPFLLFFKGLSMSMATNGALIHKSMFLFIIVLASIFLKEKINKRLLIAILLLMIGSVLILKFKAQIFLQPADLLILVATLLWAIENIISKKAVQSISPRIVAAARMIFGCVFISFYLLLTGQLNQLGQLSVSQLSWVIITGLILAGYLLTWYSGLKYLKVSTAVCLLTLGLPVTLILEFFAGQQFSISQQFGLIIMIGGVSLTIYSLAKKKTDYEVM